MINIYYYYDHFLVLDEFYYDIVELRDSLESTIDNITFDNLVYEYKELIKLKDYNNSYSEIFNNICKIYDFVCKYMKYSKNFDNIVKLGVSRCFNDKEDNYFMRMFDTLVSGYIDYSIGLSYIRKYRDFYMLSLCKAVKSVIDNTLLLLDNGILFSYLDTYRAVSLLCIKIDEHINKNLGGFESDIINRKIVCAKLSEVDCLFSEPYDYDGLNISEDINNLILEYFNL